MHYPIDVRCWRWNIVYHARGPLFLDKTEPVSFLFNSFVVVLGHIDQSSIIMFARRE